MSLVLGVKSLLEEIQWDEERTDDAEAAWARLGQHLGFTSTRPEKQYGTGPDNLWALTGDRHAVTELKTGCTTTHDRQERPRPARRQRPLGPGTVAWRDLTARDGPSQPRLRRARAHPCRACGW